MRSGNLSADACTFVPGRSFHRGYEREPSSVIGGMGPPKKSRKIKKPVTILN